MAATTQTSYEKGTLYELKIADLQPDPQQPHTRSSKSPKETLD